MIPEYNPYFMPMFIPFIPPNCDKPPTLFSILETIVNGDSDEDDEKKIKDLAKYGRHTIFNFDYPLSSNINKEEFECLILNHYLMRRIGFETVTAFRIALGAKLNEIMPMYNKMFDSFEDWDIFKNDSETTIRTGEDKDESTTKSTNETKSETKANGISKDSELPQSELSNIHNDSYLTNYGETENKGEDKSESKGESSGETKKIYQEKIEKNTSGDKISIMKDMQNNIKSIYTMIFRDLDILFYSLL